MKKLIAIVGLFLGLMAVKAEAANWISSNSTGTLISSGTFQYNVVAVGLSSANAQLNGNTIPYVVLLATNSAGGCQPNYDVTKAYTPPIYFSSGTYAPGTGNIVPLPYYTYSIPNKGVTVDNLVVCQPLGNASGVTGGQWTLFLAPAPQRRGELDPY